MQDSAAREPDSAQLVATPPGEAEDVVRWEKTCLCGQVMQGERAEGMLQLQCQECQRKHLILPISTYPEPQRVRKKRKRKEGPPVTAIATQQLGRLTKVLQIGLRTFLLALQRKLINLLKSIWQAFTPLRIAVLALTVVLLIGTSVIWRQQSRESAVRTLREAVALADEAFAAEQWGTAATEYHRAAEAIVYLNRTDPLALEVLQKHRELDAFDQICQLSLAEILKEAGRPGQSITDWERFFRLQVADKWLFSEGWLTPVDFAGQPGLRQVIPLEEGTIVIEWPASELSDATELSGHLLLAGQYAQIERSDLPGIDWIVRMKSPFLCCYEQTARRLGFELESPWMPEESLLQLLQRQRQLCLERGDKK